ncbi:MAG TPA: MEDS domain-containing protein [Labilithrix sp.]|nr:MEDS domain-containing protein [Labilithrix sp.]
MSNAPILPTIAAMRSGDHYCGIYRTDEERHALMIDFVREGLLRNEKILHIVDLHTAAKLKSVLAKAELVIEPLLDTGQLVILTGKDSYVRNGQFEPESMIDLLGTETDEALSEGYTGLRAIGEMTWALAGEPGAERLIEYESRLNDFFPGRKCFALCQYDRRRFDAEILLDVLCAHPNVLYGCDAFDNSRLYYVPPQTFLGGDRQRAMLDRWLENLSRARG